MLILMGLVIPVVHGAEAKPTKNVLILFPTNSLRPVYLQVSQVYTRVFQGAEDMNINILSESLELSRFTTPEDKVLLRQFLQERYRAIQFDLIITHEALSLDYYKEYLADIFGDTPLLVGWLSPERLQSESLPAHVSGVLRDVEGACQQTLELIPQLQPDVTEIYVLVGEGAGDRAWERDFRIALKRSSFPEKVAVQFLKGLSLEDYGNRLSQLPPTAAVFYISIFVDSKKKSYVPGAALAYLHKVTAVPLYGAMSPYLYLYHGIIGGALVNYNDLAQDLAEKGLKILRGAAPHSIPLEVVQNRYAFDWRELKRFGIDEKRLPAGAEVVQRSYTFWELYGLYVMIAALVIALQSLLLMIVARSRRNLRKTKTALQESLTTFQKLFDQSADAILLIDKNRVFVECNQAALDLLRMTREEFLHRPPVMISPEFQPDGKRSDTAAQDMMDQAYAKGLHRFDWTCINSEGNEFILDVALMPIEIQGETFLYTTWRDITGRRQAEEITRVSLLLIQYAQNHSVEELLQKQLDELESLTQSSIGFYHFVSEDENSIELKVWSTRTGKEFCKIKGLEGHHYPVKMAGVWADSLREKRPIIHNDYKSLENRRGLPEGHAEILRELVVPVIRASRVVALLGVGNKPTEYSQKDVEFVAHFAEFTWDIVAKKIAEEEIRRFKTIADAAVYGKAIAKPDGKLVYVNKRFAQIHGYQPEELIGLHLSVFHSEEQRHTVQETVAQMLEDGYFEPMEIWHISREGREFPMLMSGIVLRDKKGSAEYLAVSAIDITERKLMEKNLQIERNNFEVIFESSPIAVLILDDSNRILRANKAAIDLCGGDEAGVLHHRPCNALQCTHSFETGCGHEHACPLRPVRTGIENPTPETCGRPDDTEIKLTVIRKKKEQKVWLEVSVAEMLLDNRRAFIVLLDDITDKKTYEEQLLQSQKMEAVGQLAGGVAHDFNNMLGVILGYVEMAEEQLKPTEALHASLEEIRKAANRSADLTRQLLAFARKQTVAPKVLDLNGTVEDMLKMLRRLIGEDMDLAWRPGSRPGSVFMDPSQMDQILANLCVNARDAISGTGKITIETDNVSFDEAYCADHAGFVPGDFVMLAVSDNGCGMDAKTIDHLFEPFFTTKEMGKGTGLGLATVYGVVKQNKGFINVYSEPGQGTTFKIYLPCHEARADRPKEKRPDLLTGRGHETVLLVEDEAAILKMTSMILGRMGYAVIGASTPGEAIRLAKGHPGTIHLLMTDVIMPEMNGRDLAEHLLSVCPGMKCLFMSGYTSSVITHHGILDEGVHFIQKPFSLKDLAAKVREVLDRNQTPTGQQ